MRKSKILSLAMSILLSVFVFGQKNQDIQKNRKGDSLWSYADRQNYSKERLDPAIWNMDLLQEDISAYASSNWPTKPALSNFPSPVPYYDWGYCLLYKIKLDVGDKNLKGFCIANAKDKYRVLKDASDFYQVKFNILYLTDLSSDEEESASVISRNYPHYMSTGTQKTSVGNIDWVQMDMADGRNYALINQRYFDLEFGKTIIVIPQKDGSLRFLQIDESVESFNQDPFGNDGRDKLRNFYYELKQNEELNNLLQTTTVLTN